MEHDISYSMSDYLRLAHSPAGQQLIALLQQQGGPQLQDAIRSASSGDYANARSVLSSLLDSPEAQTLLKQLGG